MAPAVPTFVLLCSVLSRWELCRRFPKRLDISVQGPSLGFVTHSFAQSVSQSVCLLFVCLDVHGVLPALYLCVKHMPGGFRGWEILLELE